MNLGMGFLCGAVLSLAITFCAIPASANDTVTVQLALTPAGSDAAVFLAVTMGLFAKEGLNIDIQNGRGSGYSLQIVGVGQKDVGQGELGPMVVAIDKGMPVVSIAGWARRNDMSILVDRDSPIKSPQDLKGKRVVMGNSGTWQPVLDSFLRHNGMTRDDFTLVMVDASAMYTTYSSGRVDAMFGIGPYTSPIVNPQRPSRTIDGTAFGLSAPGTGVFVRREILKTKRSALVKFIRAYTAAWIHMNDMHEDDAVAAVLKLHPNDKINPDVLKGQIIAYRQYFDTLNTVGKPFGWQSEKDWEDVIAQMEQVGVIKPGRKPSDFYTNEIVDEALKQ